MNSKCGVQLKTEGVKATSLIVLALLVLDFEHASNQK